MEWILRRWTPDKGGPACFLFRMAEENDPFLYFTEDGYQFESRPVFCAVDMERKYSIKPWRCTEQRPQPSDEDESRCIQAFKELSDADKEFLSAIREGCMR